MCGVRLPVADGDDGDVCLDEGKKGIEEGEKYEIDKRYLDMLLMSSIETDECLCVHECVRVCVTD